jgi:hypothetical protein
VGAWGAICVFVGPYFSYRPTSATTWQWTTNNWMLHLLPGAVAVLAGVMIMTLSPVRRVEGLRAGIRGGLGLAALLLAAAGVWFVIGPAIWPTFQSSPAYATGTGAWTSFWNQLGANLGPGLLLAFFAGMALKASTARPAVAVGEPGVEDGPAGATAGAGGSAAYEERPGSGYGERRADANRETQSGGYGEAPPAGYGEAPRAAGYGEAPPAAGYGEAPPAAGYGQGRTGTHDEPQTAATADERGRYGQVPEPGYGQGPAAAYDEPQAGTAGERRRAYDQPPAPAAGYGEQAAPADNTLSQPAANEYRRAEDTGGPART